jgi:hypothetical protein
MKEHNESENPLPDRLEETDRKIRIERLKERLNEISGGEMVFGEGENISSEETLAFLEHVLQFEESAKTTHAKLLLEQGVELPSPEELRDDQIHKVLWRVIRGLHRQRTFLSSTDHLSDRELYALLWEELLNESTMYMGGDRDSACHLDILGGWSDEDIRLWLTYYADEEDRRDWAGQFPDRSLPPRENLPYDRDRHLPKREYD